MSMLKNYLLRFFKKRTFSGAHVSLNATIDRVSKVEEGVKVKDKAVIINSKVLKESTISVNANIQNSEIGPFSVVYDGCQFTNSLLGKYSYIAKNANIYLAEIGSFCSIGPNLLCGYGKHPTTFISTSPVFYSSKKQCGKSFVDNTIFEEHKKIVIGNDVWIGANVIIMDGVNIGDGAIVGAGSIVTKDVQPYSISLGAPAKHLRFRFDSQEIEILLKLKWWDWSETILKSNCEIFSSGDLSLLLNLADDIGLDFRA